MITGLHAIVFSPEAEKVRAFFRDVVGLTSVDAGGGWLIFAMPPAELAVHPADGAGRHELYLMCDDIHATLAELRGKGVQVVRDVADQGWGRLAAIALPDGSEPLSTSHGIAHLISRRASVQEPLLIPGRPAWNGSTSRASGRLSTGC